MILADSSIWIQHLRSAQIELAGHLGRRAIAVHPLVLGEIACGSIKNRLSFLSSLDNLPKVREASHPEVRWLIESEKLFSLGLSIVDVHLLAAARLNRVALWTLDKMLHQVAVRLKVAYTPAQH